MRFVILFTAALIGGVGAAAQAPMALSPEQLALFPEGEGREPTVRVCSGCHDAQIISQQRLPASEWARIVDTMAGHGAQGSDSDFDAITAYLTKAFPDS